jgi:three-Cys-motif partner protein
MNPKDHQFGGTWTERKLEVLIKYLETYQTALQNQPFRKEYIDAFAGSGSRGAAVANDGQLHRQDLFDELLQEESRSFRDGSTRLALEIEQPFDRYTFIEKNPARFRELEQMRQEYPDLKNRIQVIQADANPAIQELCAEDWANRRAVLFLDPYGMQVDWATVEAVAATRAIDLWLLFPLGMAVNRMLPNRGRVPDTWRAKLDAFLGDSNWYDALSAQAHVQKNLFGEGQSVRAKRGIDAIWPFSQKRLESIFPAVAPNPGALMNSVNCPLYLLCFAAGNEAGGRVALPIARHLLRGLE